MEVKSSAHISGTFCFAKQGGYMLKVENLSFSFADKDLYTTISFTLEEGTHCAFIGSNGTGKTTLVDMLLDTKILIFYYFTIINIALLPKRLHRI